MFAKLYGPDDDQVLVTLESNEEGNPCVKFTCQPEGLGVCSFAMGFDDTDSGWDSAEQLFAEMDEQKARAAVEKSIGQYVPAIRGDGNGNSE